MKHKSLEQRASENEQRDQEINTEPCNVHEGGYERGGACSWVESQTPKNEGQHAFRQGSKHDDADEARPDGNSEQDVVLPVIREVEMLPSDNPKEADDSQ